jgi:site-specific recombinase XerD
VVTEEQAPWNKGKKLPPEPLTTDEVRSLLKQCSRRAPTGIRNAAMIVVLWRGGLRCSEALALQPPELDDENGTIRVMHGKGDKSRVVGLDPEAWAILQRWLDKRKELGFNGRQPVFCTLKGQPVQSVYVRNLLRRIGVKAGVEKRVHPHGLRHTHAFELAGEGVPLHVIQQQLGHASIAVTDRYINHLNPQEVVRHMQARTWDSSTGTADAS